ncbi:cold-inducible protein YdjO-related protein [Neobacillus sp. OS1-2]|uniref:cold-inducible protein YdjO-related protein n=1 Tax=Bacillaceae TaxID=186817 RepID=UPI001A97FE6B|nr:MULTISPECIES: cold-inducible protein YdjO-related protein [Bacillaceae]WML40153.1 cold-inducible protein YdjO-related protein [Neobacillus sp. OS1-2]
MYILEIKEAVPIFYGRRAKDEEIETILVETEVYSCMDNSCIGWMRKDFVADDLMCPMCGNEMMQEVRELPKI